MNQTNSQITAEHNHDDTTKLSDAIQQQTHNRYYDAHGFGAARAFFINWFNLKGRSSRREFWHGLIFSLILFCGVFLLAFLLFRLFIDSLLFFLLNPTTSVIILSYLFYFSLVSLGLMLTPMMTLTLRRFRDVGAFTWLFYILNLPLLSFQLLYLYVLLQPFFARLTNDIFMVLNQKGTFPEFDHHYIFNSYFGIAILITVLIMLVIAALPAKPLNVVQSDDNKTLP